MILRDESLRKNLHRLLPINRGNNASIDMNVQIQPASLDLRLGHRLLLYKMRMPEGVDFIDPAKDIAANFMSAITIPDEGYVLKPGAEHFCLAETMEWVTVPDNMVARVDGRSSLGRLGLRVHSTAGFIDPGFSGIITLEMDVVGRYGVRLSPGMRICQISVSLMDGPAVRPYGHPERNSKYRDQSGATASRSYRDGDPT